MIQTFKEFLNEKYGSAGTYAAYRFANASCMVISRYITANKIPDAVPMDKLHVTLLYSRKPMTGYRPAGHLSRPMKVTVAGFDVWDTQDGKKALVARLDAPEAVQRHELLMQLFDGTYDFPEYKPHFTLSYDVGTDFDKEKLPEFDTPLYLTTEYGKELNKNWKEDDKTD